MSSRARVLVLLVAVAVVTAGAAAFALRDSHRYRQLHDAAPVVAQTARIAGDGPRIVFRHTGIDARNGEVAVVSAAHPRAARSFTGVTCDRVYATATAVSCLRTLRGVVTRYELDELAGDWSVRQRSSLPGVPSRTRLSPDGSLVATTTFVSGHTYMQVGFSTATEIRDVDGASRGNLEKFRLEIDGRTVAPSDRNIWGVTFVDDGSFYATVGTGGRTYLVRGDLADRTLSAVRENAECPSVSPDGSQVAYKVDTPGAGTHWSFAVLDLASGRETVLHGERASVDDQAEWLDDDTILYGLPRTDEPGVTDIWSLDTDASARPRLLIKQAWSPSVVRP